MIGATHGETFLSAVVERVVGLPHDEVLERLHAVYRDTGLIRPAEYSAWVKRLPSDHYRFEHDLLRRVVYKDQSHLTAQERHGSIAEVLCALVEAAADAPLEVWLDIPRHYRAAGGHQKSALWSVHTAREVAVNGLSFAEAEALCRSAVEDLYHVPPAAPGRDRQFVEAVELLLIFTEIQWRAKSDSPHGRDLDTFASDARFAAERTGDHLLVARMALLHAKVALHTQGLVPSLDLLRQAVELARDTGNIAALFVALGEYGRQLPKRDLAGGLKVLHEAEELFSSSVELWDSRDLVVLHAWNLLDMQLGVNYFDIGEFGEAFGRLDRCLARLRSEPLQGEIPIALNYFAQLKIALGEWGDAEAALNEAIAFEEGRGGLSGWHSYNTILLALIRSRYGDRSRCRRLAEEAWRETEQTWLVNLVPIVRNLYAEVLLSRADGDPEWLDTADRLAVDSIDETRRTGMVRSEIAALSIRERIAFRRGDIREAALCGNEAIALLGRYGDLPALRTEEVLLHHALTLQAAGDFATAGQLLERAVGEMHRKAGSIDDPAVQQRFLVDVPVNAAIVAALNSAWE